MRVERSKTGENFRYTKRSGPPRARSSAPTRTARGRYVSKYSFSTCSDQTNVWGYKAYSAHRVFSLVGQIYAGSWPRVIVMIERLVRC